MASYRRRLEQDLDGWIDRGLVPAENRGAILDSVGEGRRLDAATALAIIGALLAGVQGRLRAAQARQGRL